MKSIKKTKKKRNPTFNESLNKYNFYKNNQINTSLYILSQKYLYILLWKIQLNITPYFWISTYKDNTILILIKFQ